MVFAIVVRKIMRTGWRDAGRDGPHPKMNPGRVPLAAGSAGAMHLFWRADRLMDQLFNIVGIMLVGASAGATEGII